MTEKNVFAYKLFLSLNMSDFNLFFMWKLQSPLKKFTPTPYFQQPPSKSRRPVNPPFFWKFGWRFNLPPQSPAERGVHTMFLRYRCLKIWTKYLIKTKICHFEVTFCSSHFKFSLSLTRTGQKNFLQKLKALI